MALTDYVIMPGVDYEAACNSIRNKTKKTDLIVSGDLATEIDSIQTGIGSGEYSVIVIDYDGTILEYKQMNEGDIFTLPEPPSHDRLVFEEWSSPISITDNTITVPNSDVVIGALYHTVSGAMELDIKLIDGLTVVFNSDALTETVSIDWGDGETNTSLTHTYSEIGSYTIKIYNITTIGDCAELYPFCYFLDEYDAQYPYLVTQVLFPNTMTSIGNYAFYNSAYLSSISLNKNVNLSGSYIFSGCSLKSIVLPTGDTEIPTSTFDGCKRLYYVAIPYSCSSIQSSAFHSCESLNHLCVLNVQKMYSYAFYGCKNLSKVSFGNYIYFSHEVFNNSPYMRLYDFTKTTTILFGSSSINKPAIFGANTSGNTHTFLVLSTYYDTWVTKFPTLYSSETIIVD